MLRKTVGRHHPLWSKETFKSMHMCPLSLFKDSAICTEMQEAEMQPWTLFCSIFKTTWNTCYGVLTPDERSGWNVRSVAALLFTVKCISFWECMCPAWPDNTLSLPRPFLDCHVWLTQSAATLMGGGFTLTIPWKPSCQRLHNSIALLGSPDCFVCLSPNVIVAKIKCWVREATVGGGWGWGVFLPGFQQRRQHKQNPFLERPFNVAQQAPYPFFHTAHCVVERWFLLSCLLFRSTFLLRATRKSLSWMGR